MAKDGWRTAFKIIYAVNTITIIEVSFLAEFPPKYENVNYSKMIMTRFIFFSCQMHLIG